MGGLKGSPISFDSEIWERGGLAQEIGEDQRQPLPPTANKGDIVDGRQQQPSIGVENPAFVRQIIVPVRQSGERSEGVLRPFTPFSPATDGGNATVWRLAGVYHLVGVIEQRFGAKR
jgi:hypothetical protein